MLRYLTGIINEGIIPSVKTLSVVVSPDERGEPLLERIDLIVETYKNHIDCICFIGGENEQQELTMCCKTAHKHKLLTALWTKLDDPSQINLKLTNELDYIKIKDGSIKQKDYCPFGDITEWIDL